MASNTEKSASVETKEKKDKKPRINVARKLGLQISIPRTSAIIDKSVNDETVRTEGKQLKDRLKALKNGKPFDNEKLSKEELEEKFKVNQEKLMRRQAETPMAMVALLNHVNRDVLITTFEHCLSLKKPTNLAKAAHMYDSLEKKPVLSAVLMMSKSFENKLFKDAKEDPKPEENVNSNPDDKKKSSKQGFKTYIGNLIDEIKTDAKFEKIRVGSDLKDALDKFSRDIIKVLAQVSSNLCTIDDVRTIKPIHVEKAVETQMIIKHIKSADYEPYLTFMREKSAEHKKFKAEAKEKKMSAEEKAARDKKIKEREEKKAADKKEREAEKQKKLAMNGTSKKS